MRDTKNPKEPTESITGLRLVTGSHYDTQQGCIHCKTLGSRSFFLDLPGKNSVSPGCIDVSLGNIRTKSVLTYFIVFFSYFIFQ